MKRKALIIYCDNTTSGPLQGAVMDDYNLREFLQSSSGGEWYEEEIVSLNNPSKQQVFNAMKIFNTVDYSFIVFSGHGYINIFDDQQYLEVDDGDISILKLKTTAARQTLIIDACRGFFSPTMEKVKTFSKAYESFIGDIESTREIFNRGVMMVEKGWTILFAASEDESALEQIKVGPI